MNVFFDWSVMFKNFTLYAQAAGLTLVITLITCVAETILGAIFGYLRYKKKHGIVYRIITAYVEIIRNTPLLVQIFFIFYGLPYLGIILPNLFAGILTLIICHTAYMTEIFRSGISAVDKGQWEAGACIGLSERHTFIDIILPQAVRNIFPTLSNQYILALLSTSLLSSIDVHELTNFVVIEAANTFRVFENYTAAILIYYLLNVSMSYSLRFINNKYFPSVNRLGE